ncbi:prepilin-type N-terminal cleavage/methylation domain-containing protein [Gemmatimonas sp.]|uniref:PulJ/GspJ family protein n=1 Tax=Gemmatimonas sp. TaxID=1962908 RepID=UPI00286BDE94|nr:prepilin-type N-terminal cleavage/methylation domain-containing protein [Gemmatimonas sp.]
MRAQRRSRGGFTLLEVIVAITVTGLALTTAGMALSAARHTAARIQTHEVRTEADSRVRALLTDMLRHAPLTEQVDMPLLVVDRANGAPSLRFLSTGVREPYGTGAVWQVEVALRDSTLEVRATPTGRDIGASPLVATLSPVTRLDVRVLEHGTAMSSPTWRADWPIAQDRPRAIELTWNHESDRSAMPLRVVLAPLDRPRS